MPNIPTLSRWNYLGYKNKQPLCSRYPPFMAGRSRVQGKPEAKRGEACPREGKPTIFTTLKTYSCHFFPWLQWSRMVWKNKLRELSVGQVWQLRLHLVLGRLRREDRSRATWDLHQVFVMLPKATQQGPASKKERRDPEKVWWFERQWPPKTHREWHY